MHETQALRGIIPPLLSTFTGDDRIDAQLYRREVRHLLDAGVHGLCVGGSLGEGAALSDAELAQLVHTAREANSAGVPVIAGVARCSTKAALETARQARAAGADALMVTPTFYNILTPDAEGNRLFFRTIAEEVGLPLIVYNVIPQNEISCDLFGELLDIENVIGIKQNLGGPPAIFEMCAAHGERAAVFAANDEMLHSCFALGAAGAISSLLTLFPHLAIRLWDLTQAGRHAEALALQNRLLPVWKVVRGPQFPSRMKAAAGLLGRDCGFPRSPLRAVSDRTVAALEAALKTVTDA